jgi:hypothetical protein
LSFAESCVIFSLLNSICFLLSRTIKLQAIFLILYKTIIL